MGDQLPSIQLVRTKRYSVAEVCRVRSLHHKVRYNIIAGINCPYLSSIVSSSLSLRPWCDVYGDMEEIPAIEIPSKSSTPQIVRFPLQICDFENIVWENVLKGQCGASSFLVRKGLSRKAQLSLQLRRFVSKHPTSPLKSAVPTTLILETWNAFEEMKLDFGGGTFASFEGDSMIMSAPLRQRLDWCLSDAKATVEEDPCTRGWCWILKSSVTNKGADIAIISEWEHVLDAMEEAPHIREWVLQRYIDKPLLVSVDRQQQRRRKQKLLQLQQNSLPLPRRVGHKFHLRVYVLCVGALRVFVFDQILLLIAAHRSDWNKLLSDL